MSTKTNDWDLFIAPTLFAYRTTKHSTTKIEPFFLVYERSARLPMDETEATNPLNENDRLYALINDVPHIRSKARDTIFHAQIKQKNFHDKKLRTPHDFQIGDKVLYFKVTLDQSHSGKLNPKWKGPYYIHQVLPNGAYKLCTIEGQILTVPVNGNFLKLYREHS